MNTLTALRALIIKAIAGEIDSLTFGLLRIAIGLLVITCYAGWTLWWRWLPGGRGVWDSPLSEGIFGIAAGMLILSSGMSLTLGLYSRMSALICGLGQMIFIAVTTHIFEHTLYAHHYTQLLVVSTPLLIFGEPGRSLSWDRVRALKKGKALDQRSPRFALLLFKILVTSIYFWSAVDKMRVGFLSGHDIQRIALWYYFDVDIPDAFWFVWGSVFLAFATIFIELFLAAGLWFKQSQKWAFVIGAALHIGFYLALEVFTFSFTMITLYIVFVAPKNVRPFLNKLLGYGQRTSLS